PISGAWPGRHSLKRTGRSECWRLSPRRPHPVAIQAGRQETYMKTTKAVSLVVLISIAAAGLAAPSLAQVKSHKDLKYSDLKSFKVPQPERIVLDNGMVLLLMED